MTTLTIYTEKYDLKENVVNNGMSGKAFLDMDNKLGTPFVNLDNAMEYIVENDIKVHRLEINYVDKDGIQMFKRIQCVPIMVNKNCYEDSKQNI